MLSGFKQKVVWDVGCSYESFRTWVKQHEIDAGGACCAEAAYKLDRIASLKLDISVQFFVAMVVGPFVR